MRRTRKPLSVEVFRDSDSQEVSTDIAEEAIEFMNERLGKNEQLALQGVARKIHIARRDKSVIRPEKIRWPRLEADLNIVLTGRGLASDDNADEKIIIQGATVFQKHRGIAIVDTSQKYAVPATEHEIAHMLYLKHDGATFDGASHCTDETCLQYPILMKGYSEKEVPRRGLNGWLQTNNLLPPRQLYEYGQTNVDFCDECVQQLGWNAFYLTTRRTRKKIPRMPRS